MNKLGLKPIYELQAQAIAYAKITGLPIDVRNPELGIRMREAFTENWGSFTGSFLELPENAVHIILPSEKVVTMTLIKKKELGKDPFETLQENPFQEVKGPKHGIS